MSYITILMAQTNLFSDLYLNFYFKIVLSMYINLKERTDLIYRLPKQTMLRPIN